jgi:hypothetical protein
MRTVSRCKDFDLCVIGKIVHNIYKNDIIVLNLEVLRQNLQVLSFSKEGKFYRHQRRESSLRLKAEQVLQVSKEIKFYRFQNRVSSTVAKDDQFCRLHLLCSKGGNVL